MIIRKADFQCSSQYVSQCPDSNKCEYAFIGRSNVGKSSFINRLTGNGSLAKVSQTPGKTQLINHFIINDEWYLVDLPGYGYARVGDNKRERFGKLIRSYMTEREQLTFVFVLVDCRHEPQRNDMDFIRFLAEEGVPMGLIFTKGDKLSTTQRTNSVDKYLAVLSKEWEELPQYFVTSSETGLGREEVLDFIDGWNRKLSQD